MRVMVRCPTRDGPKAATSAFLRMISQQRLEWSVREHVNKFAVDVARCECVAEARRGNADFLIMVDDDVVGDERALLLPQHAVPVVSGLVPTWKMGRFHWAAYDLGPDGAFYSIAGDRLKNGGKLLRVYATGGALLCIRKDVLNNRALAPLFTLDRESDGTMRIFGGEDIMFCRKLHEREIPIYVDSTILGEHMGTIDMAATMYAAEKAVQEASDAGADTHPRMSSRLVVDTGELPVDLPISAGYAGLWQEQREGAHGIPEKPGGKVSYSKLHLA